jgi:hypothetical protein
MTTTTSPRLTQPLPRLTFEGPPVKMNDEQRFLFDLNGWVLIPGVLKPNEIEVLKQQILDHDAACKVKEKPFYDHYFAGPAGDLLDHPVIVGFLQEVLQAPDRTPDCYDYRTDGVFYQYRFAPHDGIPAHGGGPAVGPMFAYQCKNQRIYSGLTRVVVELNEVRHGQGGTLVLSGSHKANFNLPPSILNKNCGHFSTYSCPPGSVMIFTENCAHAGALWTDTLNPRMAIFYAFTRSETQYHKLNLPHSVVAAMPKKRQTLFRGVWSHNFDAGQPNNYYSEENRSL